MASGAAATPSSAATPSGSTTHSGSAGRSAAPGRWSADAAGSRSAGGTRIVRRLLSGLLPLGLLVGLFFATAPDGEVAAAPRHRQPERCAAISSGSACALGPLLRDLVRTAPLPRTSSGSR
ncbi:hypothetical protein [Nocardia cyriacigeorgica]|uniref:hypothetical protein n=1 Tax=Nocardia cyriacigeorgica TaxID=135487 RepID=UPI0018960FB9|nr:hypothetical protein [Nocardia cyriacigeorgica]MBF6415705.1 hypothetical protein [Nocardia cyriacigeorgica]